MTRSGAGSVASRYESACMVLDQVHAIAKDMPLVNRLLVSTCNE
jgi:hypothetical protein